MGTDNCAHDGCGGLDTSGGRFHQIHLNSLCKNYRYAIFSTVYFSRVLSGDSVEAAWLQLWLQVKQS